MKSIILFCSLICLSLSAATQTKEISVKVSGNCEMCQATIEKSALAAGAQSATWNADLQLLTFTLASQTEALTIEKAIAAAGYDTEHAQASESVYQSLPHCCQYDRVLGYTNTDSSTSHSSCCTEGQSDEMVCCQSHHLNDSASCCETDEICNKEKIDTVSCCEQNSVNDSSSCCHNGGSCSEKHVDKSSCCQSKAIDDSASCCEAKLNTCHAKSSDKCCKEAESIHHH